MFAHLSIPTWRKSSLVPVFSGARSSLRWAAAAATAVRKNKERKARELADFEGRRCGVFQQFDADGSGDIDKTELGAALAKLGIQANEQQLSQILTKFDAETLRRLH